MGYSWSAMRKILEQENICDSLKGRIQYFATTYRKSHDQLGRVSIRLDGEEIFKSCYFDLDTKRHEAWDEIDTQCGENTSYFNCGEQAELTALNEGGCSQYEFYKSFFTYINDNIESSLTSENPVVKLFAIMDKRVGKRRLKKLLTEVESQPEWLQVFYNLRLKADKITLNT